MSYLIKLLILCFFCAASSYAKDNPFNIMLNIRNSNVAEEMDQHLVLKVRSVSRDSARFLVKVQIPKTNISVVEGKDYYRGVLKGLEEKEFFLVVRGTKEGEGEISVKVFPLIDEMKIDNDNARLFVAKYKVSAETVISLGDLTEKDTTPKQGLLGGVAKTEELTTAIEIKPEKVVGEEEKEDKQGGAQHFVIEGTFRHNKFYRNLMVLVSILVLGYLYFKIRKPL